MDYALLNQPQVGFFTMLVIGLLAGWVAEKITASDHGLLTNLLVGICGAFVGGKLAEVVSDSDFRFLAHVLRGYRRCGAAALGLAGDPATTGLIGI